MKHVSIESLLKEIKKEKLFVNNLFEHDNGTWQANLRDINSNCTNYGFGKIPQEALSNALADTDRIARRGYWKEHPTQPKTKTKTKQNIKPRRRVRLD